MAGMGTATGRNVPMIEPDVESAYMRPATAPASSMVVTPRRTANGEAMPSRVIGAEKSSITAKNEPRKAPTDAPANASTAALRNGSATNGRTATHAAADSMSQHRNRVVE